tara:strand:+ start:1334 stop:1639 length:306 start_codon:yes stop_codon:yes gene_type:complete
MAGIEKILYSRSCLKSCNAYNISNPAIHKRVKATIGATIHTPSMLHVDAIEPANGPSARDAPKKKWQNGVNLFVYGYIMKKIIGIGDSIKINSQIKKQEIK